MGGLASKQFEHVRHQLHDSIQALDRAFGGASNMGYGVCSPAGCEAPEADGRPKFFEPPRWVLRIKLKKRLQRKK
jgi:hypothetical protein